MKQRISYLQLILVIGSMVGTGCAASLSPEEAQVVNIHQAWEIQPGEQVAGYTVAGSLGDISIELDGHSVFAPFNGTVRPYANSPQSCVVFLSDEVPAYLFRLCGLKRPRYGSHRVGSTIGRAEQLQFATLRQQPDGTWALVEPSSEILTRVLQQPQQEESGEQADVNS
ncbi:MAG: hypothetical protein ACFB8W_24460 [Elainellaceae cyanobacterium]